MKTDLDDKLTDLKLKIVSLDADAVPLRKQLGEIDRSRAKLQKEIAEVERAIELSRKAPRVSDHAVIRFLERKHGFDFENVRQSLLTPAVVSAIEFGADGVKIEGGTLKITNKCITTFIGSSVPKQKVTVK